MASRLRLHRAATRSIEDVEPGDLVRQVGVRGVGIVESIDQGHAIVAWIGKSLWDRRRILPLVLIRKIPPGGASFDSRADQ